MGTWIQDIPRERRMHTRRTAGSPPRPVTQQARPAEPEPRGGRTQQGSWTEAWAGRHAPAPGYQARRGSCELAVAARWDLRGKVKFREPRGAMNSPGRCRAQASQRSSVWHARLGRHHTKPQICSVFLLWSSEGLCDRSPPAGMQDGRTWVRGWVQAMWAGGAEAKVLALSPG